MNTITQCACLAACLFSLSTVACSSTTSAPAARHPAIGFATTNADVSGGCTLEGMPRVVATHVAPKAGVVAAADGGRIWLRFATTRDPRVSLALDPESLEVVDPGDSVAPLLPKRASDGTPVSLDLQDHRRFVAWTEGSAESGLSAKVAMVADDGSSSTAAIDLGYEGSAIGRPALAATPDGKGIVAFIESNCAGIQLVVTRVTCADR